MSKPTRATVGGRAYLDLRARARRDGRGTDELLVLYVLERFLYRVSISEHRQRLVLKGGMLLAVLDERRPTGDVDLLARSTVGDVESITEVIRDILALHVDDGVTFTPEELRAGVIRESELYSGVRITVPASLDRARHPLRVDVNIGDPVTPGPVEVTYPGLLGEPFQLLGYPLETVLAEKIVTMIDRGESTTRDRDFADVYQLTGRHPIDAQALAAAISATGSHRGSDLRPLREALVSLASARQANWTGFMARSGLAGQVPPSLATVIDAIADFADPLLAGDLDDHRWDPTARQWRPGLSLKD